MSKAGRLALVAVGVVLGSLLLIVLGSFLYWWADGGVGTPEEFQNRVQAQGLNVAWTNAGPRAGSGVVQTDCGPVAVTINDLDGDLWIGTGAEAEPLNQDSVQDLIACEDVE